MKRDDTKDTKESGAVTAAVEVSDAKNGKQAAPDEPKFTVDGLRPHVRALFGISDSTYVGATCKLDGLFTVQEMKDKINAWLKEVY